MKNIYIYPYSYNLITILQREIKGFTIKGVINNNIGIGNILFSKCKCKSINIDELNYRSVMEDVDGSLVYNHSINDTDEELDIILKKFMLNNKSIYYTCELESYINALNYDRSFKISGFSTENSRTYNKNYKIKQISKPVILILGLGQNCDKNNVGMELNDFFISKGYKPALISGNTLGALLGFYTFPILESNFEESVKKFNFMINAIDRESNPDLFIITAISGIVKHDNSHNNLYGYPSFVITSAVVPDISIMSLYAGKYEMEDIKLLQNITYYKLNTKFKYIHISNSICDLNIETNNLDFFPIDDVTIIKSLISKDFPMYSIEDDESKNLIHDKILEELRSNVKQI